MSRVRLVSVHRAAGAYLPKLVQHGRRSPPPWPIRLLSIRVMHPDELILAARLLDRANEREYTTNCVVRQMCSLHSKFPICLRHSDSLSPEVCLCSLSMSDLPPVLKRFRLLEVPSAIVYKRSRFVSRLLSGLQGWIAWNYH